MNKSGAVIFSYTCAQAIADGVLVDVSKLAKEAGFRFPVAVTAGVWAECVTVPEGVTGQDEGWPMTWAAAPRPSGMPWQPSRRPAGSGSSTGLAIRPVGLSG